MNVHQSLSHVRLLVTTQTVDHTSSSGPHRLLRPWSFSGKYTGVRCHFSAPGDLPDPGIKPTSPVSPALPADSLPAEPSRKALSSFPDIIFHSFSNFYLGHHLFTFAKSVLLRYKFFYCSKIYIIQKLPF